MGSTIISANKLLTGSFVTSRYWKVGAESTSSASGSNLYVGVTSSYINRRSRIVFYPNKALFKNQTITKITLNLKTKALFSSAAKTANTIIKYSTDNKDTDAAFASAKQCASIKANSENSWYHIELTNEDVLKDISSYCKNGTPFSFFFGGGSYGLQYYGYEVSGHPTLTIEYIPSASTGSIIGAPKIGSEFSVKINRVSTDYTHDVQITNGEKTITQSTSDETVSFFIPIEETSNWIKNEEKSSVITCNILTYSKGSQIGTYSFNFTLSVADILSVNWTEAKLTTSYITSGESITGLISGYSIPKITLTAEAKDGSKIKEYKIVVDNSCGVTLDKTYEGDSLQEQSLEVKPYTTTDSFFQVTAYAINERGVRSDGKALSLKCYAYSLPSSVLNILRTSDTEGTEDVMGSYIYNRTNFNYTSLDGHNKIKSSSVIITDLSGGSLEVIIDNSNPELLLFYAANASPESEYNIAVTIQDEISQNTLYASIPSSSFIIHIKKGGKAIGIGRASRILENTISLGWKLFVDNGIEFNNNSPISEIPLPVQNGGTGVISYEGLKQKLEENGLLNYLPISGGTISGDLSINGALSTINASKAITLKGNSFTYNGKNVVVDTITNLSITLDTTNFSPYYNYAISENHSDANTYPTKGLVLRRWQNMYELIGALTPVKTLNGSGDAYEIAKINSIYAPKYKLVKLCQGSGKTNWTLVIYPDGTITFSRYRLGDSYQNPGPNTWLPIYATWMAK